MGILADSEGDRPVAAIFGDFGGDDWETVQVNEVGFVPPHSEFLAPLRVTVISLPPPEVHAGPGDKCVGPTLWGTIGARVVDPSGGPAILTAGHVGHTAGSTIEEEFGGPLGVVSQCLALDQLPPTASGADVAVVVLDPSAPDNNLAQSRIPGTPKVRNDLVVHGAATSPPAKAWINAIAATWAGPDPQGGDWANVLVTNDGITQGGDSGAPVFLDNSDDVVGHVVGGKPGSYSLIQEIDYQLSALHGVTLR